MYYNRPQLVFMFLINTILVWCLEPTHFCVDGADIAQLVERIHGKDEVDSSILSIGSNKKTALAA